MYKIEPAYLSSFPFDYKYNDIVTTRYSGSPIFRILKPFSVLKDRYRCLYFPYYYAEYLTGDLKGLKTDLPQSFIVGLSDTLFID